MTISPSKPYTTKTVTIILIHPWKNFEFNLNSSYAYYRSHSSDSKSYVGK
jgi:hypothetical protein